MPLEAGERIPVVVDAHQWFKNGDHPLDGIIVDGDNEYEGSVVRFYRHPAMNGLFNCERCHEELHNHGWIDTLEGGHIVCPGDWIITGVHGEHYPCKPDIFEKTYEPA